tara:strand:+ start:539 stop:1021 length:483 start_codon:yes stop_codon:yes gene_type:complete
MIHRAQTAHYPDPPRAPISFAPAYEIDKHGIVYRRNKRLTLISRSGKWFAQVYDNDGRKHLFDSEKLATQIFGGNSSLLTREDILGKLDARILVDWPRYAVTSYGAIYCVEPPKRGPNAGEVYALRETLQGNTSYVTLYGKNGSRRFIRVDDVVGMVWGD